MAEEKIKTARGVVARGRTVHVPTGQKKPVGTNPETGATVYGSVTKEFGPGEEVTLAEHEIIELRDKGFLIDPNRPLGETPSEGSRFTETAEQ